jgi:hypothetical protein
MGLEGYGIGRAALRAAYYFQLAHDPTTQAEYVEGSEADEVYFSVPGGPSGVWDRRYRLTISQAGLPVVDQVAGPPETAQ